MNFRVKIINMKTVQNTKNPPKLTVPQIIAHMKDDLGIKFDYMNEDAAASFLQNNNFYYRLKYYMADFEKSKKGRFVNLDFGQLRELSTIDMYLRKLLFKMTIDAEHYFKVHLVNECQNNDADDGYAVAKAFLEQNPRAKEEYQNQGENYTYNSVNAGTEAPSVWILAECLPFLEMTQFFEFYYDYFHLKNDFKNHFYPVRRIRNAAAHNVCMLSSLSPAANFKFDTEEIFTLVGAKLKISPTEINSSMKVPVLNDFAVMLEVYSKIISSPKIKQMTFKEMQDFFTGRMVRNRNWFSDCARIKSAYKFSLAVLNYYASKAL